MSERLFIHAPNVHSGGGRTLLLSLLAAIPDGLNFKVIVDDRFDLPAETAVEPQAKRVSPSLFSRIAAEVWLWRNVKPGDLVLCFGNLPPVFKSRGRVLVFVQNRFLVEDIKLDGFLFRSKFRLTIERYWLRFRCANVDEFIVQTPTMERLLAARLNESIKISVIPFFEVDACNRDFSDSSTGGRDKSYDFLYVASGEPHKNHRQLIEAWCVLADSDLRPSLTLTLDETNNAELLSWIRQKSEEFGLNIENMGSSDYTEINECYNRASALIYPSTTESFGLPLIEARQAGLPILAAELDYVRDVVDPVETFDPCSSTSIARAVKRYLGIEASPLPPGSAHDFLKFVTGQGD